MTRLVKMSFYAFLAVICFTLGSEAQQPAAQSAQSGVPQANPFSPYGVQPWPEAGGYDQSQASQLARQLADAKTDTDKEKLRDNLKELLNKQFDNRQKNHEKEIAVLEGQIKRLKEMVAKRQDNKKEIIEEKIKQLEREARGLGW
jgi:hypothetical protein